MSNSPRQTSYDLSSLRIDPGARKTGPGRRIMWIAAALVVLLVVLVSVAGLLGHKVVVEVSAARPAGDVRASALLVASGYVTPRRRATVAAKITGRVEQIYAEEGLHVKSGQVLATLDCSQPNATLVSSRADRDATAAAETDLEVQLANAERELRRAQGLREAGVNTQESLDNARTAVDSLKSKIALTKEQVRAADSKIAVAQQDVDNCTIRAPFDGIVVTKDAQRGEIVSPISAGGGFTRTGIATVVDMASIEVEVDVNESYIARVKPRQKVIATLDAYPEWQIPGKVRTVIPTADRQKATVKVRVTFDQLDPKILPDMGVKVAFLNENSEAEKNRPAARSLVPKSAVREEDGRQVVLVVHDGKLERRAVSLGAQLNNDVEIIAGVSPGDSVVVKGATDLREGQAVEIKQ